MPSREELIDRLLRTPGFVQLNPSEQVQLFREEGRRLGVVTDVLEDPTVRGQPSPLPLAERARFAFGDELGRVAAVAQLFPGARLGRDPETAKLTVDRMPIDPPGVSLRDLPGDLLDIVPEAIRLGGQITGGIKGAALGTPAGVPGIFAGAGLGGAAGRATGQAVVSGIGRQLGVRRQPLPEEVSNVLAEGLTGTLEVLGPATPLGVSVNAVLKSATRKTAQALSRFDLKPTLEFLSGLSPEALTRVLEKGARTVLTRVNMSRQSLPILGKQIVEAVDQFFISEGKRIGAISARVRNADTIMVNLDPVRTGVRNRLEGLGLVNPSTGRLRPKGLEDAPGEAFLRKLYLKLFPEAPERVGGLDLSKLSSSALQDLQAQGVLPRATSQASFVEVSRMIQDIDNMVARNRKIFTKEQGAILTQIRKMFTNVIDSTDATVAAANLRYSQLATLREGVELDTLTTSEGAVSSLRNLHTASKTDFRNALFGMFRELPTGAELREEVLNRVAADEFGINTIQAVRSGLVNRITGPLFGAVGVGAIASGPAGAVTGLILANPKLLGRAIRIAQDLAPRLGQAAEVLKQRGILQGLRGVGQATGEVLRQTPRFLPAQITAARESTQRESLLPIESQ